MEPVAVSEKHTAHLLELTLEQSQVPTCWLDEEGYIVRANKALYGIFSLPTPGEERFSFLALGLTDESQQPIRWDNLLATLKGAQEVKMTVVHVRYNLPDIFFSLHALSATNTQGEKPLNIVFFYPEAYPQSGYDEEVFVQKEQKYFKLFNLSPDAIMLTDFDNGKYYDVNEGLCRITGYTKEQLLGKDATQINLWIDTADRLIWLDALKTRGQISMEARFRKKEGGVAIGSLFSRKINVEGVNCVISVVRDITEQKEAELKLRQSEETLRKAVRNVPVMLMAFDQNHNLIVWNKECEEVTSYQSQEMIGNKNALQLLFPQPEYREKIIQYLTTEIDANRLIDWEWELTSKDGTRKYILATFSHKVNPVPGWPVWGIGVDITAKKAVEHALIESEEKFKTIARATNDAVWDWNLLTNKIWWNDGMRDQFGYAEAEIDADASWWEAHIHQEDREKVVARIHNFITQGDSYWSDEYRFLRKDGSIAHVFDKGRIIRDEKGRALRMVGGMLDITERKLAVSKLMVQNNQLRKYAYINSHKVRGPLARIMGLVNVLRFEQLTDKSLNLINHLIDSSQELDTIVKEIGEILDDKVSLPRLNSLD